MSKRRSSETQHDERAVKRGKLASNSGSSPSANKSVTELKPATLKDGLHNKQTEVKTPISVSCKKENKIKSSASKDLTCLNQTMKKARTDHERMGCCNQIKVLDHDEPWLNQFSKEGGLAILCQWLSDKHASAELKIAVLETLNELPMHQTTWWRSDFEKLKSAIRPLLNDDHVELVRVAAGLFPRICAHQKKRRCRLVSREQATTTSRDEIKDDDDDTTTTDNANLFREPSHKPDEAMEFKRVEQHTPLVSLGTQYNARTPPKQDPAHALSDVSASSQQTTLLRMLGDNPALLLSSLTEITHAIEVASSSAMTTTCVPAYPPPAFEVMSSQQAYSCTSFESPFYHTTQQQPFFYQSTQHQPHDVYMRPPSPPPYPPLPRTYVETLPETLPRAIAPKTCIYFNRPGGCKRGFKCHFLHEAPRKFDRWT